MINNVLLGLALGATLGGIGYRTRYLSPGGVAGTIVVVLLTFVGGGWVLGVLPIVFFASANLWSRYRAGFKATLGDRFRERSVRGWDQVMARAGWSIVMVLLYAYVSNSTSTYAAYVGSLAASAADTWATEVGVLSPHAPRLITSKRKVNAGREGAISVMGTVAALGASWLLGFAGLLTAAVRAWVGNIDVERALLYLPLGAMIGGIAGCLTDSLLGAAAQGLYQCEDCGQRTERQVHSCGKRAVQIRGWGWLTNDGVNLVSSVVGAAVTAGAVTWLAQTSFRW